MMSNTVEVFSEDIEYQHHNLPKLESWIQETIEVENKKLASINIIFCSDSYLLKMNQDYLSHDYFTDIITFQYADDPIEGELYISVDRVKDNATQLGVSESEELHRVIIHGVLHLIGYKDKTSAQKKVMREKENVFLSHWGSIK